VSRFEKRKNHISLLKAYITLKLHENYDLVFIGNHKFGDELKNYKELLKIIPRIISRHIHFFQSISNDELNAFYKQSSCFVYPSYAEGFGIPPLEAAINCCKVLCSDRTAMEDFSFFKYRFNPNNIGELEQKLTEVIEDKNYPFEEIKQMALKKYNWDETAKETISLIQRSNNKK